MKIGKEFVADTKEMEKPIVNMTLSQHKIASIKL
jgi:hypothetical protein